MELHGEDLLVLGLLGLTLLLLAGALLGGVELVITVVPGTALLTMEEPVSFLDSFDPLAQSHNNEEIYQLNFI